MATISVAQLSPSLHIMNIDKEKMSLHNIFVVHDSNYWQYFLKCFRNELSRCDNVYWSGRKSPGELSQYCRAMINDGLESAHNCNAIAKLEFQKLKFMVWFRRFQHSTIETMNASIDLATRNNRPAFGKKNIISKTKIWSWCLGRHDRPIDKRTHGIIAEEIFVPQRVKNYQRIFKF